VYHRPSDANRELDLQSFSSFGEPCSARVDEFGYIKCGHSWQDFGRVLALYRLGGEPCGCLLDWLNWQRTDYRLAYHCRTSVGDLSFLQSGLVRRRRLPKLLVDSTWDASGGNASTTIANILRSRGWPVHWKIIDTEGGLSRLWPIAGSNDFFSQCLGDRCVSIFDDSRCAFLGLRFPCPWSFPSVPRTPAGIGRVVVVLEAYLLVIQQLWADKCLTQARVDYARDIALRYLGELPAPEDNHDIAAMLTTSAKKRSYFHRLLVDYKKRRPCTRSDDVPPTA
jgi:hypothetical protein